MKAIGKVRLACGMTAVIAVIILMTHPAQAITYSFSGGPMSGTGSFVPQGSFFTGMFTYDPNAPVLSIGGNFRIYDDPTGVITFMDGSTTYTTAGVRMSVTDSVSGGQSTFVVFSTSVTGSPAIDVLGLYFIYNSGIHFGPAFLPPASINVSDLSSEQIYLRLYDHVNPSNDKAESGPLTSLTAVPEPATMLLLGSGLIGLAGYGRKKFFKK